MPIWRADLHIHTVLSGCAEAEMIPPLIVQRARARGLDAIGIADHNSAANAAAVVQAAGDRLVVKPGLEIETRETVHLLCLFDEVEQALDLQRLVYDHLPERPESEDDPFGPRLLVDKEGVILGREPRPLYTATDLPLGQAVEEARGRGGLVVASHVQRRAHGILGVLGFIPQHVEFDGLEGGPGGMVAGRLAGSDAHRLEEIGARYTVFEAEEASVSALRACLGAGAFRTGMAL